MTMLPDSPAAQPAQRLRPLDAASLLLIDRSGGAPRVLMGRRHAGLVFMPGKFVFPGGRADPADRRMTAASELQDADREKLLAGMGARPSESRARALGLCAIRETFEETGLRIALPGAAPAATDHADWRAFLGGGLPALGHLRYFARAVTPPGRVRRFDTRFFLAFRDSIPGLADQALAPSGELENLDWTPLDRTHELDTPRITQCILREAQALLSGAGGDLPADLPVVQYSERRGRFLREVI